MKNSEAVAIFCNINNSKECNSKKIEAIKNVTEYGMVYMSITKQEYVNVLDWLMSNYDFREDRLIDNSMIIKIPEPDNKKTSCLEPMKIGFALKAEIYKYNYRKEHEPQQISALDLTVIYALYEYLKILEGEKKSEKIYSE